MNAPDRLDDWTGANQRLLVAEFARLRALLGDGDVDIARSAVDALRAAMPEPAAIDTLAQRCALSGFERDVLLLAAGVEMDAHLAALAGPLQRHGASFGLALATLPDPHWSAIAPLAPLRRFRLVELEESARPIRGGLRLDERVLHFLGGLNDLDHRLQPLLEPVPPPGPMSASHLAVVEQVLTELQAAPHLLPLVVLEGDDEVGQRDAAAALAERLGIGLYRLRASDVPAPAAEQAALAALWSREAVLLGCGLLVTHEDGDARVPLARFVGHLEGLVLVTGRDVPAGERDVLRHAVERPDAPDRRRLWQAALGARAAALGDPALDMLASQYRLGARRIAGIAARTPGADAAQDIALLHRASRGDARSMPGLAQRIDARAGWSDLVLPEAQRDMLRQIAVHARHRLTVHHDWGFGGKSERGLGISTLFWGDSGTGKTLAAEVLAHELALALYRIDLSAVVSKYIGDTEKHLRQLFDAAEEAGAILLFDEADALFGKRSEVKDSHDRYANIEVSYLLQRMESYGGLAILTTNHKAALDTAFQRRLRFVVHFPFPDPAQREGIWHAAFPPGAPLEGIDFPKLARLGVAGGSIRNIALSAAFLAADAGTPLTMSHLRHAAHLEAAKRNQPFSEAETRGWA